MKITVCTEKYIELEVDDKFDVLTDTINNKELSDELKKVVKQKIKNIDNNLFENFITAIYRYEDDAPLFED